MEQENAKIKRSGWSELENNLLWETADEAQQQGLPLKSVFDRIAQQTGRRPNSIRNYYYAQVRQREGEKERIARFVPFEAEEVDWLMEQVLTARADGQSVRACLQKLAGGDHSLMLRYQNKYRAMIKNRPDYVREIVGRLNSRGVSCDQPQVNARVRLTTPAVCDSMNRRASEIGDPELAHALEIVSERLLSASSGGLHDAVHEFLAPVRDFLALPESERAEALPDFCAALADSIGSVEACLAE